MPLQKVPTLSKKDVYKSQRKGRGSEETVTVGARTAVKVEIKEVVP